MSKLLEVRKSRYLDYLFVPGEAIDDRPRLFTVGLRKLWPENGQIKSRALKPRVPPALADQEGAEGIDEPDVVAMFHSELAEIVVIARLCAELGLARGRRPREEARAAGVPDRCWKGRQQDY